MKIRPVRRTSRCLAVAFMVLLAAVLTATPAPGLAQKSGAWPDRPIRMVIGSTAGGILDQLSRAVSTNIGGSLGQQVLVDYRPGASGIIAMEAVSKAPADGYTIGHMSTTFAINPYVYAKLPYDSGKDFIPVGQTFKLTNVLVVHPKVPANSIAELVALARQRPGSMTYASAGVGGSNHLSAEIFARKTGIELVHVPYKGPATTDMVAGVIDMMFLDALQAIPLVRAGKLKALGITGVSRLPALPDIPLVRETVPDFDGDSWTGIVAPAGTPKEIIDRLSDEIGKALAKPEVRDRFLAQGIRPAPTSPQAFAGFLQGEMRLWESAVRAAGIVPGQY